MPLSLCYCYVGIKLNKRRSTSPFEESLLPAIDSIGCPMRNTDVSPLNFNAVAIMNEIFIFN